MVKKLKVLNLLSAAAFCISSMSLLFIPLLKTESENKNTSYIIALLFWIGLIIGIALQVYLSLKCKKMHLHNKTKKQRILLLTAAVSFIAFMTLVILKSKNSILVVVFLFCTMLSLQLATIIKRKEYLK